ncbi:uncharacterized protein [Apostichopus japonicus]|uniref:uncharacterized protein isoform X3 n=1 Tax=Stichopus japonicus TaxID=307972 RepID=UPI003AB574D1
MVAYLYEILSFFMLRYNHEFLECLITANPVCYSFHRLNNQDVTIKMTSCLTDNDGTVKTFTSLEEVSVGELMGFYAKRIASSTNMKKATTIKNHVNTTELPTVPITTGHCAADKMDSTFTMEVSTSQTSLPGTLVTADGGISIDNITTKTTGDISTASMYEPPTDASCGQWHQLDRSFYCMIPEFQNLQEAEDICRTYDDAHLASISSVEEDDFVSQLTMGSDTWIVYR